MLSHRIIRGGSGFPDFARASALFVTTDCIVVAISSNVKSNNNDSTYLPTHTTYVRIPMCDTAPDGSASAASELEVGLINPTMQELRAAAAKQAGTWFTRVALCGVRREERGSPRTSAFVWGA